MAKFQNSTAANSNFNMGTAGQTNGFFLPEVYSKKVQNFFRKASVAEAITNTDYAGEISAFGDSVNIIKEPTISVSAYLRNSDVTETRLTDAETQLVVDQANAFKFIVDDIETKMSHVNFKEVASSSAAYALKDEFDKNILTAMLAGASGSFTPHGGSGTSDHIIGDDAAHSNGGSLAQGAAPIDVGFNTDETDPLDLLARMARLLDEQNVPEEGRYFVAAPEFYEILGQSGSKLMSVDFNAGQGSIRNGLVSSGKLRGFEMYKSNNIPATSTGGVVKQVLAGHMSAVATAQSITSTEVLRDPTSFGDICRGLHVFGRKVLRPEALIKAFYSTD
tara:strand:- start:27159 stop:28160 length:1002 start_codon:yes stop_codon:yes gene_type:complete